MKRFLTLTKMIPILVLLSFVGMKAQPFNQYIVNESIEQWTPITGTIMNPPGENLNQYGNDWGSTDVVPIGFNFPFDNNVFTTFSVDVNGHMKLGGAVTLAHGLFPSYNTSITNTLAPFTEDACSGSVRYQLQGDPGSRVLIIQWNNFRYWTNAVDDASTMQVKLYENGTFKFCYGPNFTAMTGNVTAAIYACGDNYDTKFKGIYPGNPSSLQTTRTSYVSQGSPAARAFLTSGKTYTFSGYPTLNKVYPSNEIVYVLGNIYGDASPQKPGVTIGNQSGTYSPKVYVKIKGPIGAANEQVIYEGLGSAALTDTGMAITGALVPPNNTVRFNFAKGIAAGANGAFDLTNSGLVGGEYIVESRMEIPSLGYVQNYAPYKINVALGNDLELSGIAYPRSNDKLKYPTGMEVPVSLSVKNVGFNTVNSLSANVKIYYENETTPVYDKSVTYTAGGENAPLTMGMGRDLGFDRYIPNRGLGNYRVVATATLLDPTPDMDLRNNSIPRQGATTSYFFTVANALDIVAYDIRVPGDSVPLGRPIVPIARLKNLGVNDLSAAATVTLTVIGTNGDTVYSKSEQVETVPQLPFDIITEVAFDSNLIVPRPGTYTAILNIVSFEDNVQTNNTFTKQFTTAEGLSGTYTIGSVANATDASRNYLTIQDAVSDLYYKSITGSVVFELTDSEYTVENAFPSSPAIDLSSNIIGNDAEKTITFRPSAKYNTSGQLVNVNLSTPSGIGILLGQNTYSSNSSAPVNNAFSSVKNKFAKPAGFITFDGGINKNLQFTLNSTNNFRTVFYLGQGASNNTIKNIRMKDGAANPAAGCNLPKTTFNASNNLFGFEKNQNYTAGILMRSIVPYDANIYTKTNALINTYMIDTLVNHNNVIDNNIIKGFTYGIASLGIGALHKDTSEVIDTQRIGKKLVVSYYNHDNTITNNLIQKSKYAGILLGFENNTVVRGNKIDTVINDCSSKAYGILLGSEVTGNTLGYNNTHNVINGNEISYVRGNGSANGISVIQNRNAYTIPGLANLIIYPNKTDRNIIINNSVWNIAGNNDNADLNGITVATGRSITDNNLPAFAKYRTIGDVIANNTVLLLNDGMSTKGTVSAIKLQQTNSTKVFNNALYLGDNTYADNGRGAILNITSQLPANENIMIDKNVYYGVDGARNDFAIFTETNANDVIYSETGAVNEYKTLDQWQNWTKQDLNSFWYDFTSEIVIDRNRLTIRNTPDYPLNSKLNNTGYKYDDITLVDGNKLSDVLSNTDINGVIRGVAGSSYDIGSVEFTGRAYLRDLEAVKIISPNSYKSYTGAFSDLNYVMTNSPVNVKALIRNNGNMVANNILVKAVIYREFADGNWDSLIVSPTNPTETNRITNSETYTTRVNIDSYNSAIADFNIGNPNQTPVFVPKTYYETRSYNVPNQFKEMVTNVTPRYKIEISIVDDLDQEYGNNKVSNTYRFFIKKSNLDLMVTAENTTFDKNATGLTASPEVTDKIAGRLNYDSLKASFNRLGWKQVVGIENPFYHFDVMDRNSWEPRALDYTLYNSLFWSDGHDKPLTRLQEYDMRKFADNTNMANNWNIKKALVIASQEFLRQNTDRTTFLQNYVKATSVAPHNPMGADVSYDGYMLRGNALFINQLASVKRTGFSMIGTDGDINDVDPMPALMTLNIGGDGVTAPADYYVNRLSTVRDTAAGAATFSLIRNVVYLGQDWRHFGNIDLVVRGINDFNAKHGSDITPVELIDFEAIDRNKNVEISWATATESNSKQFEIEKATVNQAGRSSFEKIATEPAAGKSNTIKTYGPIIDKNVNYGETYVYRLRSVDADGETSLSNEVEVSMDNFFGVAPNPASTNAVYTFSIGDNQFATIELFDVSGKMVKSIYSGNVKASDKCSIDVTDLPNGTYTIVLKAASQTYTTKLSVRK